MKNAKRLAWLLVGFVVGAVVVGCDSVGWSRSYSDSLHSCDVESLHPWCKK